MRQGGLTLAAGRVRSKKKKRKIRPTENTPRKPQQPGDCDRLETACHETRPTRSPTLARFHRSRACGSRLRTALAISKKGRMSRTHILTDKINTGTLYAPRYEEAFCLKGKKTSLFQKIENVSCCLLYTSPSPRDGLLSRMPSSA